MGHGLPRQNRVVVTLGQLALIKSLRSRVKADGKLGRLHRGPGQIRMAIFDIARAFAFAIADFRTVHTAAIRGRVTNRGKPAHMTGFKRNRLRQNRADAIDRQELLIRRGVLETRRDGLFQRFDLLAQAIKDCQAAGDRSGLLSLGK